MNGVLWSASVEHLVFLRSILLISRRALAPVHAAQTGASALRLIGVRAKLKLKELRMAETTVTPKSCSQCGFTNPAPAKFCSECGERFAVVRVPNIALEPGTHSATHQGATASQPVDPRAAFEQFVSTLAAENAASRLQTAIEASRAHLKTLGVPLPKATNPILVSLMESLKALPSNEISARIAIVTALGRMGDPAVLPPLLLVTGAQFKDVRQATAIALGCIRHPLSAYLLLPMLQDGSSRVRQAAFQALIQLNQPHTMEAILAACLGSRSFRSLILETLRLVTNSKRSSFFQLLTESNADQQPELKIVADWLRFEFRNAISESRPAQTANTAAVASQPTPAALPQKVRPQEGKSVRQPATGAADSQSSESSMFGWGNAEKTQTAPASDVASAHRYGSRTNAAVANVSRTADQYEMSADFNEDDDYESDVRLYDDSNGSATDLGFFNSHSESIPDHGYSDDDDNDRSELAFASNGSQSQMSLSGMLAAPEILGQSSHQVARPAAQSFSHDNRPSGTSGHPKHGSPEPAQSSFPFSAYDTATAMGNTPGLSMPFTPMMHPGMMPAAPAPASAPASAFDMTASSPLIPAFTHSAVLPAAFTATTHAAGRAGADVSSTAQQSGTASGVTNVLLPDEDEPSNDEIEAAKALARAAHEKALARLSAARNVAFRKLMEDAEEIPKKMPRLLQKRVAALMATPSMKIDRTVEQLLNLGAMNSPAALSTLASFCQKPAKQIREASAEAIGCITHPGSAILLLKLIADKSGMVVEAAIKAMAKLDLEPTRPVLLAAGLCGSSLRTVVTVGVESAADDKKSEWEALLLEHLRGDDADSGAFAVSLLARLAGDTHLEIFQKLASDKVPMLRAAAVEALGRTQAKRAIAQINEALEDADPTVRAQAAMSVATMYSPRSLELLQKLVFDSNLNVRRNAAQSMSRIDESDLADVIARALDQETDATTVEYLLAALQRNGANSSLPILQRYIEGESSQFREQAVKALRKLKIPASVPIFRRLLDDHAPALRRQAIEQLAVLKSESMIPLLREMLKQDPDETVRSACAKALGDFGDETSVHLLEEALEDHPLVRLQAVIALGRLGQTSAGPILLSLMRDQLPEVRYQAVRSIAHLKLEGVDEHVFSLLDDADELVRRGAEQTLTDLGVKTGSRKARQWKRRISGAASWIAPSSVAGMIPGGAKTLFVTVMLLVGIAGMFSVLKLRHVVGGEDFNVGKVGDVALNADSSIVAVLRRTAVLDLWSTKDGKLQDRCLVPRGTTSVTIEKNGGVILFNGTELRKLDTTKLKEQETAPVLKFDQPIADSSYHPEKNALFLFFRDGDKMKLQKIDCETFKQVQEYSIAAKYTGRCIVSPDETMAVMVDNEGNMTIGSLQDGEIHKSSIATLTGQNKTGVIHAIAFSDDMKFIAISAAEIGVVILKTDGMSFVKNIVRPGLHGYTSVVFQKGSHDVIAVSSGGAVTTLKNEFEAESITAVPGIGSVGIIDVGIDGDTVVVGNDEEKTVWLVSSQQKSILHELSVEEDQ